MALVERTKYICTSCGHSFWRVSPSKWFPCAKCKSHDCFYQGDDRLRGFDLNKMRRTPLSEWQKKKLEFYRDEKKWHEDIAGRRALPDGRTAVYSPDGKLKEIRPKGGAYYGHSDDNRKH